MNKIPVYMMTVLVMAGMLFGGCRKKSIEIDAVPEEESTMIAGSWMGTYDEDTFYGKSYTADGYYQIKNNLMQFTSYDDGKDYVICTQTNCHHNGKDCAAWINGGSLAKGLARYNKKLYVVDYSLENQKYTLKTADQTGENQKIIAEIPCGDTKKDGWCMASVDDVYYCNNTAWCTLQYDYMKNGQQIDAINQCVGYDLDTGEKTELTELKKNNAEMDNPFFYRSITERKVCIGDYADYSFYVYDTQEKQIQKYDNKSLCEKLADTVEDLSANDVYDVRLAGSSDKTGLYYFEVYVYADQSKETAVRNMLFSWDLKERIDILADYGEGGTLFKLQGNMQSTVWGEKEILYAIDQNDKQTQIMRLDLLTEKSTPLFLDDIHISFRVLYDCDTYYIGTLDEGDTLCRIDRQAYDTGDFSKAVKIKKLGVF